MQRFSLKSLLALVTLVGILCWAIPAVREWMQWQEVVASVQAAYRDPVFTGESPYGKKQIANGRWVVGSTVHRGQVFLLLGDEPAPLKNMHGSLETGEVEWDPQDPLAEKSLFILPPGKWAASPEEALQVISSNPKDASRKKEEH